MIVRVGLVAAIQPQLQVPRARETELRDIRELARSEGDRGLERGKTLAHYNLKTTRLMLVFEGNAVATVLIDSGFSACKGGQIYFRFLKTKKQRSNHRCS